MLDINSKSQITNSKQIMTDSKEVLVIRNLTNGAFLPELFTAEFAEDAEKMIIKELEHILTIYQFKVHRA